MDMKMTLRSTGPLDHVIIIFKTLATIFLPAHPNTNSFSKNKKFQIQPSTLIVSILFISLKKTRYKKVKPY